MFEFSEIVALYVDVISVALPFTITFWLCDFVVCTILKAAFGGRFPCFRVCACFCAVADFRFFRQRQRHLSPGHPSC